MCSRNPSRIEQDKRASFTHGNRLADLIDPMIQVRRIDVEAHHSGVRNIFGRFNLGRHRRGLRSSTRALGIGQACNKEKNNVKAAQQIFQIGEPGREDKRFATRTSTLTQPGPHDVRTQRQADIRQIGVVSGHVTPRMIHQIDHRRPCEAFEISERHSKGVVMATRIEFDVVIL